MRRRALLASLALGGCSLLPSRPYLTERAWPLEVRRPVALPPDPNGPVLLVRTLAAAPGLEARGLQSVAGDGSIHTDYYEEWSVPPADAVEEAMRRWLAECGAFAAVLAPGSRARADLALEGELQALLAVPAQGIVRASLAIVLLDVHGPGGRVVLQRELSAQAPLRDQAPGQVAAAGREAVAGLLSQVERAVVRRGA